ncbi:MAG: hypothetical protein JWP97_3959 [Labilithrix sp.]|nr:hypothetical protein [Labilithrix sp.]
MPRLFLGLLLASSILASGCAAETGDDEAPESADDALRAKADDAWFYAGPLPALKNASVTVSLAGNTARISGIVPDGASLDEISKLPHVKARLDGGKTRLDIVYPIATAAPPKTNSRPGTYSFVQAKPYRPDGNAWTQSLGNHFVTWGGFPFVEYNSGIAFHGPITEQNSKDGGPNVWYLRRGDVSSGCNRMLGENVVELTHVLGLSMRKVYGKNQSIANPSAAKVTVLADYDAIDGKYVDTDYATDVGVVRPGVSKGADKVTMFGSWVASEMPNGADLPPDQKWEGGVSGKPYVFADHARNDMVCSFASTDLAKLKVLAATFPNSELPRSVCAKKACVVDALRTNKNAKTTCAL